MNDLIKTLKIKFDEAFNNNTNKRIFFAPGRVNLIGEHTDYNGGYVLPAALNIGAYLVLSKRNDKLIRCASLNFEDAGITEYDIDNINLEKLNNNWTLYVIGVITSLRKKNINLDKGFDVLIYGDIPNGAGLSSSASLVVAFTKAFNEIYNLNLSPIEIAQIAQNAEHFAGTLCGIMDQFASSMGKKNHAMFLNCNNMLYKYAPVNLGNYSLIIMNSNKKRKLNESKYNERRSECETALNLLKQEIDAQTLCDITLNDFNKYSKKLIENDIILRRARHAITENERCIKAFDELTNNNIKEFGQLINESHYSLKDDYEVTGYELDVLTDVARNFEGSLGARMTGAGFGGCAIAIILKESEKSFMTYVDKIYNNKTNLKVQFINAVISDGAREIIE